MGLLWCDETGGNEPYREQRRISCRLLSDRQAFAWTWKTHREALLDGRRINYHGLGVRLTWPWAFPHNAFSGVEIEGKPVSAEEACGTTVPEVTFWGLFDGFWEPPRGAVTVRQRHGFGWYIMKSGFCYVACGPSALEEIEVASGRTFDENYEIIVADGGR